MKTVPIKTTTVSLATGEVTGEKTIRANLLPPHKDACQECGTMHPPEQPHNAQALYYQYAFYGEHDRWPNWKDAMAHCSDDVRTLWTRTLIDMGVDVDGGKILP